MSEEKKKDGSVLQFVIPDEARPPIARKKQNYTGCKHQHAEVDEVARKVTCQDCGIEIDPVQFLLYVIAHFEEKDYKYQKILEFERKEQKKEARRSARRAS